MKFSKYAERLKHLKDEEYMSIAIKEAEQARLNGDPAIGAVLVLGDSVYSENNTTHSESDPCNHAEMNVIRKAISVQNRLLQDAVLFSTIEPCLMCAMAAHYHGIREIVFGAYDDHAGFISSNLLTEHDFLGIAYKGGVLGEKCKELTTKEYQKYLRT